MPEYMQWQSIELDFRVAVVLAGMILLSA